MKMCRNRMIKTRKMKLKMMKVATPEKETCDGLMIIVRDIHG